MVVKLEIGMTVFFHVVHPVEDENGVSYDKLNTRLPVASTALDGGDNKETPLSGEADLGFLCKQVGFTIFFITDIVDFFQLLPQFHYAGQHHSLCELVMWGGGATFIMLHHLRG